jgi:uncharacterized protein YbaP (TraB family)
MPAMRISRLLRCFGALLVAAVVAPAGALAAPAMWKVSDSDSSVWLFGSIHVLPPGVDWRTPAFDAVLAKAETVYFEADVGPLGQLGIIIKSLQSGITGSPPWLEKLTPEQSERLTAAITPLGLTRDQLGAYAPWLAEAEIEDKVLSAEGFSMTLGVDPSLQAEIAKERKAYFETAGEQMDMLAAAPLDAQISRLMAAVDDVANMPRELRDMANSWSAGRIDELAVEMQNDPTMDEGFTKSLVLDRNARWVETVKGLLSGNHEDLIVVGAGHLAGKGSVVDLLANAGFTVKRIQ